MSPDRSGNPFSGFFSQEKIETDSGNSSQKINTILSIKNNYTINTKQKRHLIRGAFIKVKCEEYIILQ